MAFKLLNAAFVRFYVFFLARKWNERRNSLIEILIETRDCLYKKKTKKEREQMIFF